MAASSLTVYQEVALPAAPALLPNNLVVHRSGEYVSYAAPTAIVSVQTSTGVPCFRPLSLPAGVYVEALAGVTDAAVENLCLVAVLSDRTAIVVVNGQQTHVVSRCASAAAFTAVGVVAALTAAAGPSKEMVAVLGDAEGGVELVHLSLQGQPLPHAAPTVPVHAHEHRGISALDVCADDGFDAAVLLSGDVAGHVVVWRATNPVLCLPPTEQMDAVAAVKLLPHTTHAAIAYSGGQIKVVERETGASVAVLHAHSRWINALSFSATTQRLVSAAEDGQIFVWNTSTTDAHCVCVAHGSVQHELLTGAASIGAQNAIALLSYDVRKLRLLSF